MPKSGHLGGRFFCEVKLVARIFQRSRVSCPGRGAAFFTLLRRTGTVMDTVFRYGPGSAAHHAARAARCAASGERSHVFGVFAGLDPAIHHFFENFLRRWMDARVKPAHDANFYDSRFTGADSASVRSLSVMSMTVSIGAVSS
jgi:hypothetical protein